MLALAREKPTHGGEHYAAMSMGRADHIGTLSWLAAVVIIAAVLLGGMVLLNALVQRYWPQDVSWRGVLSYKAWGGRKPTRSLTVPSMGAARCLAASSNVAGSSMKAW